MTQCIQPGSGMLTWLKVPIAAASSQGIEKHVGRILDTLGQRADGQPDAIWVQAKRPHVSQKQSQHFSSSDLDRLFPAFEVWVHVDNRQYRAHYKQFAMPPIPEGCFLDHIQNRRAIRLQREILGWELYPHPLLRLCPVTRQVNTSGGHSAGGEGMEKAYLNEYVRELPADLRQQILKPDMEIVYADPMDLTKMLNEPPGTQCLGRVGEIEHRFFRKDC